MALRQQIWFVGLRVDVHKITVPFVQSVLHKYVQQPSGTTLGTNAFTVPLSPWCT